jgi:hypothetical protein
MLPWRDAVSIAASLSFILAPIFFQKKSKNFLTKGQFFDTGLGMVL